MASTTSSDLDMLASYWPRLRHQFFWLRGPNTPEVHLGSALQGSMKYHVNAIITRAGHWSDWSGSRRPTVKMFAWYVVEYMVKVKNVVPPDLIAIHPRNPISVGEELDIQAIKALASAKYRTSRPEQLFYGMLSNGRLPEYRNGRYAVVPSPDRTPVKAPQCSPEPSGQMVLDANRSNIFPGPDNGSKWLEIQPGWMVLVKPKVLIVSGPETKRKASALPDVEESAPKRPLLGNSKSVTPISETSSGAGEPYRNDTEKINCEDRDSVEWGEILDGALPNARQHFSDERAKQVLQFQLNDQERRIKRLQQDGETLSKANKDLETQRSENLNELHTLRDRLKDQEATIHRLRKDGAALARINAELESTRSQDLEEIRTLRDRLKKIGVTEQVPSPVDAHRE